MYMALLVLLGCYNSEVMVAWPCGSAEWSRKYV